ncbi:hypothetical protein Trydic_g22660 [Trypoxylus dichotomus]
MDWKEAIIGPHQNLWIRSIRAKEKRRKLDKKSMKLILTGYDGNSTNYRLFNAITKEVGISRDTTFCEGNSVSVFNNHVPIVVDNTYLEEAEGPNQFSEEEEMKGNASKDDVTHTKDIGKINLRPRHLIKRPTRYEANLADVEIPETFKEAMESDDSLRWKDAIEQELEALKSNETWEVVPLPTHKIPIKSKWVFAIKKSPRGEISRYKARLCAKGYEQRSGIDVKETFSPTVRYDCIRILLPLAAKYKLGLIQFDVKTVFLYGVLDEEIYMEPPDGIEKTPNTCFKLKKSLYGLKQSSRCWNKAFDDFLKHWFKFQQCRQMCLHRTICKLSNHASPVCRRWINPVRGQRCNATSSGDAARKIQNNN